MAEANLERQSNALLDHVCRVLAWGRPDGGRGLLESVWILSVTTTTSGAESVGQLRPRAPLLDVASTRRATVRPGAGRAGDPGRGQALGAPSLRPARCLAAEQSPPPGGFAQFSLSSVSHRAHAEPLCVGVAAGDGEVSFFAFYSPLLRLHGLIPGTGGPILGMCAARTSWPCIPELRQSHCSRQVPREAEKTEVTATRRAACAASSRALEAESERLQKSPCTEATCRASVRRASRRTPTPTRDVPPGSPGDDSCQERSTLVREGVCGLLSEAPSLRFIRHV